MRPPINLERGICSPAYTPIAITTGDVMGKGKKNQSDNFFNLGIGRKYVALPYELLDSPAWHNLSKAAQLAYINILRYYNGFNAHNIIYPRSKLVCNLGSHAWLNATQELEKAGFVLVLRQWHHPNIFSLSNGWKRKIKCR